MEKFKGVKFATAKRFGHPVPVPDLKSIEDIECEDTICPQPPSGLCSFYGKQTEFLKQSEDCLRISVYTPDRNASLPVLVSIHGGSYLTGSGQYVRYDASDFVESEKIVVVLISYRLGMLGFFGGKELALEDQVCALEWIKRNIHLFGGDGSKMTVMGQSAGAHSLLCHIACLNKPLFDKAILMSAPFLSNSHKSMQKVLNKFLDVLPCSAEEATIDQIIEAQNVATRTFFPSMPLSPVCSKLTTPAKIMPGLKKVIVMYHQDDAAVFSPFKYMTGLLTKLVFALPAKKYVRNLIKRGVDAEVVVRTWGHKTARFGAVHFMEIPLLMGDWKLWKEGPFLDGISDSDYELESAKFKKYIGDFVK